MPTRFLLPFLKTTEPGRLVVLAFDDESSAFALRELLCQLEEEGVIEVGDAVVATRNAKGKVRLHQSLPLVAAGRAFGGFTGLLLGLLVLHPLFGYAVGSAVGAAAGAFGDLGIDDVFMKSLGETLTPGSSALFVVVHKSKPEEVLERIKPFAGRSKILQCNMTAENEALLRNLLGGELSSGQFASTTSAESKS